MDGLTKLEIQEQITAQVKEIVGKLDAAFPEEWTKPQVYSVFQLFLELYR